MTIQELTRTYKNLFSYIKNKFSKISDDITAINDIRTQDKMEIDNNTNSINDLAADNILLNNRITELENNPSSVSGSYIEINNIHQKVLDNVKAGTTIEIDNKNNNNVFLVQCFAQIEEGECVVLKNIECKPENRDLFEFDERYVELTDSGFKPKTYTTIPLEKAEETDEYTIYESTSPLTEELLENINNITEVIIQ